MNFDDKFMGMLSMLGMLNGNGKQNNGGLASIIGLLSSMNGNAGVDIMKILPLLTAMKGENPLGNTPVNTKLQDADVPVEQPAPKGYKDKYDAIGFAGNEVIYTLGKLWKVREM